MKCKNGNPKKASRFICLCCLDYKTTYIPGIQRKQAREKFHIKDSVCIKCGNVKTMEVRFNDYLPDIIELAIKEHNKLYDDDISYEYLEKH